VADHDHSLYLTLSAADLDDLRYIVWDWDPLGLGFLSRFESWDEYDCILEFAFPLIEAGWQGDKVASRLDRFLPDHFSIDARPGRARIFVNSVEIWLRDGRPQV